MPRKPTGASAADLGVRPTKHAFARRNYLAYAIVLWLMTLRTPMMQLFASGNGALEMQAGLIAALMAASLVWALAPALLRRAPGA
jgi:hypothetical protein